MIKYTFDIDGMENYHWIIRPNLTVFFNVESDSIESDCLTDFLLTIF